MKINTLSALLGAASLGIVLLTVSAFQVSVSKSPTQQMLGSLGISIDGPIQVEGIPTPSQMMRIVEGTLFTVPPGKTFVATGVGLIGVDELNPPDNEQSVAIEYGPDPAQSILYVPLRWMRQGLTGAAGGDGFIAIPPGLTAKEGEIVRIRGFGANGVPAVLLGYLADN